MSGKEIGRRARISLFWRSLLIQGCWSFERMQGLGLAFALQGGRRLPAGQRRGVLLRHLGHFNTQPHMAGFVIGMLLRLEDDGRGEEPQAAGLKDAVSRSLAAIGDVLFWGTLRPIAAALGVLIGLGLTWAGMAPEAAWPAGVAGLLLIFNLPALTARWAGLGIGYRGGAGLALELARLPWQRWIRRLRLAGAALAVGCASIMLFYHQRENPRLGALGAAAAAGAYYAGGARAIPAWALYGATCLAGVLAARAGWLG